VDFAPLICTSRLGANESILRDTDYASETIRSLASARELQVATVLGDRERTLADTYSDLLTQRADLASARLKPWAPSGQFHFETLHAYVVLVLVQCAPLDALVWRGFGQWNDCPSNIEMTALLAHWSGTDGTELVAHGGDYLELRNVRFLTDARRRDLAWEQFITASDIVYQGTRTVAALANELGSGRMFLWWD
jgi:hypothetical protein